LQKISKKFKPTLARLSVLLGVLIGLAVPVFSLQTNSRQSGVPSPLTRHSVPNIPENARGQLKSNEELKNIKSDLAAFFAKPETAKAIRAVAQALPTLGWKNGAVRAAGQLYSNVGINDSGLTSLAPFTEAIPSDRAASDQPGVVGFFEKLFRQTQIGAGARHTTDSPITELPKAELNQPYCVSTLSSEIKELKSGRIASGIVPKGLIFNRQTGMLCGSATETGIFRFGAVLEDTIGFVSTIQYRLVVAEKKNEPSDEELQILTSQLSVGQVGAEYAFQLKAKGGTPPLSWEISGLPDGLEFDGSTGVIGGSPAIDGEFSVTLTVRDGESGIVSRTLELIVRITPVFITTRSLDNGTIDEPYQTRLGAQGGAPPYAWEIIAGALPAGLEFNQLSGAIEGVPEEAHEGVIRFRVIDSLEKNDTADLPLEIRPTTVAIETDALQDGLEGAAYSFVLAASGGTPPYVWTRGAGSLPVGVTLDPTGRLFGASQSPGEYAFSVSAEDTQGQVASRRFRLRIQQNPIDVPEPIPPIEGPTDGGQNPPITPGDGETPLLPAVSEFEAASSDSKVGLVWKNPLQSADPSTIWKQTIIIRNMDHPAQSLDDGKAVYTGTGDNFVDTDLENGRSYFYAAFVDYGDAGLSEPIQLNVSPQRLALSGKPDPFVDQVVAFNPLDAACFNCSRIPSVILGAPRGSGETNGSTDVVSIGARINTDGGVSAPYGGSIVLKFTDNIVVDGPGVDFTIFENAFRLAGTNLYFVEPAVVEVSLDGVIFYRFPFDFVPHYNDDGSLNLFNPFSYAKGFAGIRAVYSNAGSPDPTNAVLSGGDSFDLSQLPGKPLSWIRFIRITSTGDSALVDQQGDTVRHSHSAPFWGASGTGNSGFDLDAIAAVNY
jgi:hypothetical protein